MSAVAARKANFGTDASVRRQGRFLPLSQAIPRLARILWPAKTDMELAIRTGTSDRRCRELLAERAGLSAEALAALLRTEDGLEFLAVLMGDAKPVWWRKYMRTVRIADLRRAQEEQRKEIERLELESGDA